MQIVENNYQDDSIHNDSIVMAGSQNGQAPRNYSFGGATPAQSAQKQESSASTSQGNGSFRALTQRKQTK